MRELFSAALLLGLASGALEAALRASPRLGMSTGELATFLALAVLMGLAVCLPAAAVARPLRRLVGGRDVGLVVAALVAVHAALAYRFELVLNLFVRDPRVWGGLLAIAVVSLVIGLLLDAPVRRARLPLAILAVLGAVGALVRGQVPEVTGTAPTGPDIVFITLDTVRADQLGVYGGPAPTPHLEALARRGARFDQAIAPAPLTEPSHLALMTGEPTHVTGVVSNGTVFGDKPELLARQLQSRGYATGGFVSGFPLHAKYGWSQGFHVYDDDFGRVRGLHRLSLVKAWDQLTLPGNTLRERTGDNTTGRALAWLRRSPRRPLFLWVHLFDAHAPYEAPGTDIAGAPRDGAPLDLPAYWPPPHRSITSVDFLLDAYHRELTLVDGFVGELLGELEAQGRLERALVVVTADHGESLTEHDYLFDHGDDLYDPSLHIPLILAGPGVDPGSTVPCQVGLVDVAPTVRDLLGIPQQPVGGVSLMPTLAGAPCSSVPLVSSTVAARYVDAPPIDRSLRTPQAKYIRHGGGRGEELYLLQEDPGELNDVAGMRAVELAAARYAFDDLVGDAATEVQVEMDAQTRAALEALGYLSEGDE